jgi:hypothetical protein
MSPPPPKSNVDVDVDVDAAIVRSTTRWQQFYVALTDVEKTVLDKAALGHKLKVVCYELDVPYDTVQKRFKRWQEALGLSSLNQLLHVWQSVRTRQPERAMALTDDVPTIIRYTPDVALAVAMQRRPGYQEVTLPDTLRKRARGGQGSRGINALCSEPRRQLDTAEHMAECVMSPALWLALLTIGQEVGASGLQRAVVPFQHQLFLQMLGAADAADAPAYAMPQFFEALASDETHGVDSWGEGAPLALPLALTARALGLLSHVPVSAAEADVRRSPPQAEQAFWASRAQRMSYAAYSAHNDAALWQRFCAGVRARDDRAVASTLHALTLDIVLGPLTGMAVAIVARSTRFAAIRDEFSVFYPVILRARLRHAQHLGLHPRRLLAYFALQEAGLPVQASTVQLAPDENIVTEVDFSSPVTEAVLRRVERRLRASAPTGTQSLFQLTDLLRAV